MRRELSIALTALILSWTFISSAEAAARNVRTKAIKSGITKASVTVTVKKKKVKTQINCYKKVAGVAKKIKGGYSFVSFRTLMGRVAAKKDLYKALHKTGGAVCASGGGTSVTPLPEEISLNAYTGSFGEEEARILFDRFGFGASPERIQQAVQDGLKKTITKLTTFVPEPELDAIEASMKCSGLFPEDPRNGTKDYTCDPTNPNDIDIGGLKFAMLYRHIKSQNGFFERLGFFLHDRFQSVNPRVLGSCNRWAVVPYVDLIRRSARNGDYVQYLREFGSDYLGAVIWLHLLNSSYVSPNEDEGREILQLGGTGPYNLDGSPVYGDLDIAQCALALTGWVPYEYKNEYGHRICNASYSDQGPLSTHSPGPHTIFIGTPHQSQVSNLNDVVDAIKRHPRLGEYIAEQIYDDFINPYATPEAIRNLAAVVREKNYNLVEVMKVVMGSKAIYASKSRKSIPKQPLEILVGFLKVTGTPSIYDNNWLRSHAENMGQLDLSPNTVFGWRNRDALAGEAHVLTRRNVLISLLNQDISDLKDKGFNYWDRFVQGIPADGTASAQFVKRLQKWFNVSLNSTQEATMVQFLDYNQYECNQWSKCATGQKYYLERDPFDAAVDSKDEGRESGAYKTRGAIGMITMMPEYLMK